MPPEAIKLSDTFIVLDLETKCQGRNKNPKTITYETKQATPKNN